MSELITSGGLPYRNRERAVHEWSLNGSTTTTILFGRMPIHTGFDAAPTGSVHGVMPLASGRASRLRNVTVDNPNTWGVAAFFLMSAQHTGGTYAIVGICHATIAQYGGTFDFWSDGGVPPTKVWQIDNSGGPSYVDETTDSGSFAGGDITLFPASEEDEVDTVAIGHTVPFRGLSWSSIGGTAGIGGAVEWGYWNGSAVVPFAGVTDGTTGFTAAASHGQQVTWTVPTDWVAKEINGSGGAIYYAYARITTVYGTNPTYSHVYVLGSSAVVAAGYLAALGHLPNGAQHGDTRFTAEFEAA